MADDLSQYKDLYLQTSREYLQSLNTALLKLEKAPTDGEAIEEIFRSAHTLKSQSSAMGYINTGYLCHTIEDVFYEIKQGNISVDPQLADQLFSAFDALTRSVDRIDKEGLEADLLGQIDTLKKISGVKTEGAGKSIRQETKPSTTSETTTEIKAIPVKVTQLDEMLNILEEMVVARLGKQYEQLDKLVDSMHYQLMKARAVPVKMVLDHFPRAVRDLAKAENKEIELEIIGAELELDRSIVDRLDEPLIHIIRNAVSHGIQKAGKITITAKSEKDCGVIEVADNGTGIDWAAVAKKAGVETTDQGALTKLLFSGISTSEQVTQVSGRGVGLSVVKKTVEGFGGSVEVFSTEGKGTTFVLKLPLTMAIIKSLLVGVGVNRYVIAASSIDRIVKIASRDIKKTADIEAFILEEKEIPLVWLSQKFGEGNVNGTSKITIVVCQIDGEPLGLVVDKVFDTKDMIIKPVPKILKKNISFSGVTNLGDGQSALVINPRGLL